MGDGTGVGDGDYWKLPAFKKGEEWFAQHNLKERFCAHACYDGLTDELFADDYDTNYALLLSLSQHITATSPETVQCFLHQLNRFMCK